MFDNRSLFSDHYLATRLPDHPEWAENMGAAWEQARALYAAKHPLLNGLNEAQTEEEWVKPLLTDVLGWCYAVQTDATLFGKRNRPDYILFASEAAKAAAHANAPAGQLDYTRAAAVGDAKFWGRPLDRELKDSREPLGNANPSFQIVNYLVATGVDWGILTNGREWRLYSMRARSRIDTYYAVDLARILDEGDADAFRWFLLFFRAAAFRPDPASGQSFLDAVLAGSTHYGAELEARLKKLIFEDIFPLLARGFVHGRREAGQPPETEAELREIYAGTLRLLYRILFVLYAEARELLPVDDAHGYGPYSLNRIRRRVAERLDRGDTLSRVSDDLWNDLAALFRILDRGDAGLNVPRYNGGLFRTDHRRNRFFATHSLADFWLYPALERLTRDADGQFIDFKALSVQQLGSIYEGLLEWTLRLDPAGEPVLTGDRGERHSSGSFYTPQFVVEHIVEQAVGPVLAERTERFRALMGEIEPKRERLAELEAKLAAEPRRADAASTRWTGEANALRAELKRQEPEAVDALLGIRICDPAMGSGHFLVHATDWLTERLIVVLNAFPDNPVLRQIGEIRAQIVGTLAEGGITVDPERLRDTHLLKRMVMKRCIYGVDLNPMAVELAKLSLWLDSFTVGAPLSFLDHHLKAGNSLVGTTVQAMREGIAATDAGQTDAFGGPFAGLLRATTLMRDVAVTTDATFAEVAHSAELYGEFERAMRPYKLLLDVWTSRRFGNRRAEEVATLYGPQVLAAARDGAQGIGASVRTTLERAAELREQWSFFHWDLEFPEVFVDLEHARWKENAGFDAVIGNPPYVRNQLLKPLRPYLRETYSDVYHKDADLHTYFFAKGLQQLRDQGLLGYIASGTFRKLAYGEPLRHHLTSAASVEQIIDFSEQQVFTDATTYPAIFLIRQVTPSPNHVVRVFEWVDLATNKLVTGVALPAGSSPWLFSTAALDHVLHGWTGSHQLHDVLQTSIRRGITAGHPVFGINQKTRDQLIKEDANSATIIKPLVEGKDLHRWYWQDEGRWLIMLEKGWTKIHFGEDLSEEDAWELLAERYPAIARYLASAAHLARKRHDQGDFWWELRPCRYYNVFEEPRIFSTKVSRVPAFSEAMEPLYAVNTAYVLPVSNTSLRAYLLGLLNPDPARVSSWPE